MARIAFIKYSSDGRLYPYFIKGQPNLSNSVYLVGENNKNIEIYVDHVDIFDDMVEVGEQPYSYLKTIRDITEYLDFTAFEQNNRCKKVKFATLDFMKEVRAKSKPVVDYMEEFEKLSPEDQALYDEGEKLLMKSHSDLRKEAEVALLERAKVTIEMKNKRRKLIEKIEKLKNTPEILALERELAELESHFVND